MPGRARGELFPLPPYASGLRENQLCSFDPLKRTDGSSGRRDGFGRGRLRWESVRRLGSQVRVPEKRIVDLPCVDRATPNEMFCAVAETRAAVPNRPDFAIAILLRPELSQGNAHNVIAAGQSSVHVIPGIQSGEIRVRLSRTEPGNGRRSPIHELPEADQRIVRIESTAPIADEHVATVPPSAATTSRPFSAAVGGIK